MDSHLLLLLHCLQLHSRRQLGSWGTHHRLILELQDELLLGGEPQGVHPPTLHVLRGGGDGGRALGFRTPGGGGVGGEGGMGVGWNRVEVGLGGEGGGLLRTSKDRRQVSVGGEG